MRRSASQDSTHHSRVDKCAPTALIFKERKGEGDNSGTEKNDDKLILELLEDELPDRGGRFFRDSCARIMSVSSRAVPRAAGRG